MYESMILASVVIWFLHVLLLVFSTLNTICQHSHYGFFYSTLGWFTTKDIGSRVNDISTQVKPSQTGLPKTKFWFRTGIDQKLVNSLHIYFQPSILLSRLDFKAVKVVVSLYISACINYHFDNTLVILRI